VILERYFVRWRVVDSPRFPEFVGLWPHVVDFCEKNVRFHASIL
jgi:hypothetical protein